MDCYFDQGTTAMVTGCSRGLGRTVLEKFAENKVQVYAHARNETAEFEEYCRKLSEKYGVKILPVYFDMTDEEKMKQGVMYIKKECGAPEILVNNAGMVNQVRSFRMTTMAEMRETFEVNFFAQMKLTQLISGLMARYKRGSIVNISSCAGLDGNTGTLAYVSSKAALIAATKNLAIELGDYGIRVNSIAPGPVDTDMGSVMPEELMTETLKKQVFVRKATTEEIADAVLFLSSERAGFITGQVLRVDGGMLK